MSNTHSRPRFLAVSLGTIAFFLILSRAAAHLYTIAATDILYSESILPTILSYVRQIATGCAYGAILAGLTTARTERRLARMLALCSTGFLFLTSLWAFLSDLISHAVIPSLLPLAALFNLGEWALGAVFVWASFLLIREKTTSDRGIVLGALVVCGGRFLLQLVYIIQFLIDVEFQPYASEWLQMAGEVIQILVIHGGVVWLSATALYALLAHLWEKK